MKVNREKDTLYNCAKPDYIATQCWWWRRNVRRMETSGMQQAFKDNGIQ